MFDLMLGSVVTKDRIKIINSMSDATDAFYRSALSTKSHTWLELVGFMRELIKIYGGMLDKGIDPLSNSPLPEEHHVIYIAEKLDCIFGDAMRKHPKLAMALANALQDKGWPMRYAKRAT